MAVAILAAVHYRDLTGKGQSIDMAMADNVINMNRSRIATTLQTGRPVPRPGTGREFACPSTFISAGGRPEHYLYIQCTQPEKYAALMRAIGREDLIPGLKDDAQARWAAGRDRRRHRGLDGDAGQDGGFS